MLRYATELSKYIILLFMFFYVTESILYLFIRKYKTKRGICIRQRIYLFLIQFFAYLALCLRTGKLDYLFFYAFLQIGIFSSIVLFEMIYGKIEGCLLNHMMLLLSIGFIILTRLDFKKAVKQFIIAVIALIISFFVPYIIKKFRFLKNCGLLMALCGIGALGAVLILGNLTNGSKLAFRIAGVTFQPSEFVKIVFVFAMAGLLYNAKSFFRIALSAILAAAHVLILVLSKDLGSGVVFFIGYLFMLLIATSNYLYFIMGCVTGSGAAVVAYHLFSHVRVRVQAFLDPFMVIDNQGYQIAQSLFAISCGGWFGTGLLKGMPSDIPYVESDSIFSAICEEMGVLFGVSMLIVCLLCFILFLKTASRMENQFYRLIAGGLGVMYLFQVFLTVGGGLKFIPLTGVTLPFVSYGGSSVLASVLIFAVMQGIYLIYEEEQSEYEDEFDEDEDEYEYEYEDNYGEYEEYGQDYEEYEEEFYEPEYNKRRR